MIPAVAAVAVLLTSGDEDWGFRGKVSPPNDISFVGEDGEEGKESRRLFHKGWSLNKNNLQMKLTDGVKLLYRFTQYLHHFYSLLGCTVHRAFSYLRRNNAITCVFMCMAHSYILVKNIFIVYVQLLSLYAPKQSSNLGPVNQY